MSGSSPEYLRHILDETVFVSSRAKGVSKRQFMKDETLKRAFVRSIEIIGEASKKLPTDLKQRYPGIEWRSMAGMRDRLIHGYFGIDYQVVWDVVRNEIPRLKEAIEQMLEREVSR